MLKNIDRTRDLDEYLLTLKKLKNSQKWHLLNCKTYEI